MALTALEIERRKIVINDRLMETHFIRKTGTRPDTAEVWMAIADGYYRGDVINVTQIARKTLMDKATIMRHVERLMNMEPALVTRRTRGQDTILRLTDEENPERQEFFSFRYRALVENASNLIKLGIKI